MSRPGMNSASAFEGRYPASGELWTPGWRSGQRVAPVRISSASSGAGMAGRPVCRVRGQEFSQGHAAGELPRGGVLTAVVRVGGTLGGAGLGDEVE